MKLFQICFGDSSRFAKRSVALLIVAGLLLSVGTAMAAKAAKPESKPATEESTKPAAKPSQSQILISLFPEKQQEMASRMLDRAGDHKDKVAGAIMSVQPFFRQFAFPFLVALPQEALASHSEKELVDLVHTIGQAVGRVEPEQQIELSLALYQAGDNRGDLIQTLTSVKPGQRKGAMFLILNMPERDLKELKKDFLVEQISLAYEAWENAPWHDDIPESIFMQYILPYANLNETRENWRAKFMDRLKEEAWKCKSPTEVRRWLNKKLNTIYKVKFHATKRPKADQSPFESIEAGYASCTGLSILLVDACRSVGVPARLVGVPEWTIKKGNHNWVEVWDGQWYNIGGTKSDKRNKDWVAQRCKTQTDADDWMHSVYVACFRKTNLYFPLVWDFSIHYVPSLNVTRFYTDRQAKEIEIPDGGKGVVEVYWAGELIGRKAGEKSVTFALGGGNHYQVRITTEDGQVHKQTLKL